MAKLVFGTPRFSDIENCETVCRKYDITYSLNTKKSRIGYEETWYQLVVDIFDEEIRNCFLHDIHNSWMPLIIKKRESNHA